MPIKTIEIPDGFELVQVDEHNYKIVKKEEELPKTWEEFCERHPLKTGESWLTEIGSIQTIIGSAGGSRIRGNILPNEEYSEAILALCQLIQLRDCYRQGWKPDWTETCAKHYVTFCNFEVGKGSSFYHHHLFTFQTEELRDKFLKNFKDLIEKTKPLFM